MKGKKSDTICHDEPYKGYQVSGPYGPYPRKGSDKILPPMLRIYAPEGKLIRIAQSKFNMEVHLGRKLKDSERIIFLDGDCTNISLSNLSLDQPSEDLPEPYGGKYLKIRGPYFNSTNQKYMGHYMLTDMDGNTVNLTVSRYIIETKLKRLLKSNEQVVYKDGNNKNIHPDNLDVGIREDTFNCPECGKLFQYTTRQYSMRKQRQKRGVRGPFCSKSCAAKDSARRRRSINVEEKS